MFKNYIKLAFKVLAQRPFFTFISLFGISFTLMILIVLTAFLETELGAHQPLTQKDRLVFMNRVIMKQMMRDTIWQVDTTLEAGAPKYDSTFTLGEERQSWYSASTATYSFLDRYMRDIPGVEAYSFYSPDFSYDLFANGNKLSFKAIYADASFWAVYDFQFLAGRPFRADDVTAQAQVVVLTRKAARDYFGTDQGVIGKHLEMDGRQLEVIGLIGQPANSKYFVSAEAYLPLTLCPPAVLADTGFQGPFEAVFMGASPIARESIKQAIASRAANIPLPNPEEYNYLELMTATFAGRYAYGIFPVKDSPSDALRTFLLIGGGLLLLFILLPTLNLINLNVSRIMERSAEIGVRKAFGAHSGSILAQLVFENIVLTFIGGLIGLLLALGLLYLVNDAQVMGDTQLQFNARVFAWSVLICLLFGIISGLLPAWRMSQLHIANAIKQNPS